MHLWYSLNLTVLNRNLLKIHWKQSLRSPKDPGYNHRDAGEDQGEGIGAEVIHIPPRHPRDAEPIIGAIQLVLSLFVSVMKYYIKAAGERNDHLFTRSKRMGTPLLTVRYIIVQ